ENVVEGLAHDLEVERQRCAIDVLAIQSNLQRQILLDVVPDRIRDVAVTDRELRVHRHLEQTREARSHRQDSLPAVAVVVLDDVEPLGARADDAHVPLEHVQELGELVDLEGAEDPPDASHSFVSGLRQDDATETIGVWDHGSELVEVERAAVLAVASGHVEHGARRVELDEQGDEGEQRQQDDERGYRDHDIDRAVDHLLSAGHGCPSARPAPARVTTVKMHSSPNANRPCMAPTNAVGSPMSRPGRARNAPRSGSSTISTS